MTNGCGVNLAERDASRRAYLKKWRREHPDAWRRYKAADLETYQERDRVYHHKNKEARNIARRLNWNKNREDNLAKCGVYYQENMGAVKKAVSVWATANKDKVRAINRRYRANKKGALINDFYVEQWTAMKEEYSYHCAYCFRTAIKLGQDHLVPLSKGGDHTALNIVPACQSCNSSKGNRSMLIFAARKLNEVFCGR